VVDVCNVGLVEMLVNIDHRAQTTWHIWNHSMSLRQDPIVFSWCRSASTSSLSCELAHLLVHHVFLLLAILALLVANIRLIHMPHLLLIVINHVLNFDTV